MFCLLYHSFTLYRIEIVQDSNVPAISNLSAFCVSLGEPSRALLGDCIGCVSVLDGISLCFGKDLLGVTFSGGFLTSNSVGIA